MRIRVAGLIEMENGFALMHRTNVKKKENSTQPYGEYYVFPGGGLEKQDNTYEDGVRREVLEEFGIEVEVKERLYHRIINGQLEEYLYRCVYKSGKLGTGTGPEFSGDPKYIDRGNYIPTIVDKKDIRNIRLLPEEFKENMIKDFNL